MKTKKEESAVVKANPKSVTKIEIRRFFLKKATITKIDSTLKKIYSITN